MKAVPVVEAIQFTGYISIKRCNFLIIRSAFSLPASRPTDEKMDGRHSWVVLIAALVVYTHALGMGTAYGVFFIVFTKEFEVSLSAAALVASIMYGTTTATGMYLLSVSLPLF